MSAATIDRALCKVKEQARGGTRRRSASSVGVRRSVPVRTFDGWDDPAPGFMEADLVAHSGPTAEGSFVQTLTLTDIATRLDGVCAVIGPGADGVDRGVERGPQADAVSSARV